MPMSRSNSYCGFVTVVTFFVVVMYDGLGEYGNIEELLIAHKLSQHSHSAKRYVDTD
jgi:hypothetical protein